MLALMATVLYQQQLWDLFFDGPTDGLENVAYASYCEVVSGAILLSLPDLAFGFCTPRPASSWGAKRFRVRTKSVSQRSVEQGGREGGGGC